MARDKGSGSAYQRASDGRWVGTIEAGWSKTGARRRVVVTAKTKREALVKVKERQRELAADGLPAEGVNRTKKVKGYCEHYLAEVATATLRPGALDATKSAVSNWIIPTVGHIRLEQVTPAHVELVGRSIVLAGKAGSTALRYQQVFVVILKHAMKNGHPIAPSALLADFPQVGKVDRGDIPLEDAKRIVASALTLPDGARWLLALLAAVRPAEALGLRWQDVDLVGGRVAYRLAVEAVAILGGAHSWFWLPCHCWVMRWSHWWTPTILCDLILALVSA